MSVTQLFDGDFPALASLMQSSWSENREQQLLYTPEFLRSAFDYPGTTFELSPALYGSDVAIGEERPESQQPKRVAGTPPSSTEADQLIAFGAGFPRTICANGHVFRLALDSFITVSPAHKGKRLGGTIWGDIAARAQHAAYDGLITFTVAGDRMNSALPHYSSERELSTMHMLDIHYLARPLAVPLGEPVTGLLAPAPIDLFLECAVRVAEAISFARIWTAAEAEWQCTTRYGALSAAFSNGNRAGALSGYFMQTSGTPSSTVAIIDDILWNALDPTQRGTLLRGWLQLAKERGADLAITPLLHYADMAAFKMHAFRLSKRLLHMYLTAWPTSLMAASLPLSPLPSAYIDVF